MNIYRYSISTTLARWPKREGLILQKNGCFAEIAPLPGFSKETLEEALQDLYSSQTTASVRFALSRLEKPFRSIRIPLASKLKLGHLTVAQAVAFVKSKTYPVRVDCNRMWSLSEALEFASAFKASDFDYLEEPVRTWEELVAFSKITSFPIALDESIHSNWNEIPSLSAIVVKPTVVGYIPSVPSPLRLILSSSYESGIGLLHIASLASELQLKDPVGLDTYSLLKNDLLTSPIDCSHSHFSWEATPTPVHLDKLCPIAL